MPDLELNKISMLDIQSAAIKEMIARRAKVPTECECWVVVEPEVGEPGEEGAEGEVEDGAVPGSDDIGSEEWGSEDWGSSEDDGEEGVTQNPA